MIRKKRGIKFRSTIRVEVKKEKRTKREGAS